MKKRVLSMLMTLALCLTLFPAPAWAAEDTPEGGAIVQQEQQEEQQEAPAAEPSTILEQAAENGIAVQDSEDSTVENTVQYKNCFPNFHTPMARSGMFMSSTSVPVGIFVA